MEADLASSSGSDPERAGQAVKFHRGITDNRGTDMEPVAGSTPHYPRAAG